MPDDQGSPGIGQFQPSDAASDFNYLTFVIQQLSGKVRTALEVQVVSCTNVGGLAPFGLVTVQPVVRMQDGGGFTQAHGPLQNLTYFRVQGGANAIICDPQPGDLGVAFVLDRDTSAAVANAVGLQDGTPGPDNTVPPGSWRRFSLSDGFYVGGNLNTVPTSYLQFYDGNINLVVPPDKYISISAGTLILHGVNELTYDAGGTGAKLTPTAITSYTQGVTESTVPPDPPGPLE